MTKHSHDRKVDLVMAHELEISVPGPFVVLQGSPGDGMSNSIDNFPTLPESRDEAWLEEAEDGSHANNSSTRSNRKLDSPLSSPARASLRQPQSPRRSGCNSNHPGSALFSPFESNMSHQQRLDERSLQEWRSECRDRECSRWKDWKATFQTQCNQQQQQQRQRQHPHSHPSSEHWQRHHYHHDGNSRTINSIIESRNDRDAMWWQIDGGLALLRELPSKLKTGVVMRTSLETLSPGSTLVASEIIHLDSSTLKKINVRPSYQNGDMHQSIYPHGEQGVVQVLKVARNESRRTNAYVVLSVDGYPLMAPGLPSSFLDPDVWIWRVTCPVGAFVRLGLELNTKHVDTIPYGSLIRVTRKTVNQQGLSRLRVQSILQDDAQRMARLVDGWCSEFLNPLSGQRGSVAQPLSFPVPALYKVRLPEGAVIRRDVELSSPQIGHAPMGAELSIIGRAFSDHPMDRCIERLRLAGNGGWVSVRLNRPPPGNELVVEFVGLDSAFDPDNPGMYHLQMQRQVEGYIREAMEASGDNDSDGEENGNRYCGECTTDDDDGPAQPHVSRNKVTQRRNHSKADRDDDKCLICLTEERNATIVHGETGHVACCLVCARILKARGDKCPVCRFEIDMIIQHFWA